MHEMTGLTLSQLDSVYKQCRGELASYRLSMRQADENTPVMSPHNMLCVTIHWLRKGSTFREMEERFHRRHQWLHTMVMNTVRIIDHSMFNTLIRPIDSTSPPSTMSTIFDAFIVVDSTFIPLLRSPFRPTHYHPKSPTKTAWKVQIACDLSHRIVDVSQVERGAEADQTILLNSGLLEQATEDHRIIGEFESILLQRMCCHGVTSYVHWPLRASSYYASACSLLLRVCSFSSSLRLPSG